MAIERKVIEFLKPRPPYQIGDVAGFPVDTADTFIKHGTAKEWDGKKTRMYIPKPKDGDNEDNKSRRRKLVEGTSSGEYVTK